MPPEFQFLQSPVGIVVIVGLALAAIGIVVAWAVQPGHAERWQAVAAATITSALVAGLTLVAASMEWWGGAYLQLPLIVLLAIDLPLSIAGYTLWLGGYRWLRARTRHALPIYGAVVLAFIPVVFLVDPIQIQRGQFTLGGGYTIWIDALVGQVVLWSPVLAYEALRHLWPVTGTERSST